MHPIAFKIGNFPIYFYGLMMVIAYLTVLIVSNFTRKRENLSMDIALDIVICLIIGGIIGSRLLYVLINASAYLRSPLRIFFMREGGLSWHGALLGAAIALLIFSKVKKIPFGKIADFAAVHGTLGLSIGRIGCFLNGCCYGKICNLPWKVEFKGAGIPGLRHPIQIYESFLLMVSFIILLIWWGKKKFDGELAMAMFAQYGVIRFFVEFFRENTPDQYFGKFNLSMAQYLSIALFVVFTILIVIKRKLSGKGNGEAGKGEMNS